MNLIFIVIALLFFILPYLFYYPRFAKKLQNGELRYTDYKKYAFKILAIYSVLLMLIGILVNLNMFLLALAKKAYAYLAGMVFGDLLTAALFVGIGILVVIVDFKIFKIKSEDDMTSKKIWGSVLFSGVLFAIAYVGVFGLIATLLANIK